MDKQEIIQQLQINHQQYIDMLMSLDEKDFMYMPPGKWTAGQHFRHIYLSVSPLSKAMKLPAFVLGKMFGEANRPSKTFEGLVKKYTDKLAAGGAAMGRFIPQPVTFSQRNKLKHKIEKVVKRLCNTTDKYSEERLDNYIIPHPLLGKLTIREMLYFTIYHVQHHHKLILRGLGKD